MVFMAAAHIFLSWQCLVVVLLHLQLMSPDRHTLTLICFTIVTCIHGPYTVHRQVCLSVGCLLISMNWSVNMVLPILFWDGIPLKQKKCLLQLLLFFLSMPMKALLCVLPLMSNYYYYSIHSSVFSRDFYPSWNDQKACCMKYVLDTWIVF